MDGKRESRIRKQAIQVPRQAAQREAGQHLLENVPDKIPHGVNLISSPANTTNQHVKNSIADL